MNLTIEEHNKYRDIFKNYNLIKATIRGIDLEIKYLKNNNELSGKIEKLLIINKLIELRYLNLKKLTWVK